MQALCWRRSASSCSSPRFTTGAVLPDTASCPGNAHQLHAWSPQGKGEEPLTGSGVLIANAAAPDEERVMLIFPATREPFCFNFIGDGMRDALDRNDR